MTLRHLGFRAASKASQTLARLENQLAPWSAPDADASEVSRHLLPEPVTLRFSSRSAPGITVLGHLESGAFYGGMSTALIVAGMLAELTGSALSVACTRGAVLQGADAVARHLAQHGISPERVSVVDCRGSSAEQLPRHVDDIFLASAWWDALAIQRIRPRRPLLYLIQDFEPGFYPQGDAYALAESSYADVHQVPLFNTSVLEEFFDAEGYAELVARGVAFEPARGQAAAPQPRPRSRKLFFYGRPEVSRNLYALGLQALQRVAASPVSAGWTFYSAGSEGTPPLLLGPGNQLQPLGKLSLEAYEEFAGDVDVAFTPMLAPHPNYPTLELAARGAHVVTTSFRSKTDLTRYSGRIATVRPEVTEMSEALLSAMTAAPDHDAANLAADWRSALAEALTQALALLAPRNT